MPSLLPILNVAPFFGLYDQSASVTSQNTQASPSSFASHSTTTTTSASSSTSSASQTYSASSPSPLSSTAASPATTLPYDFTSSTPSILPMASSSTTPAHIPFTLHPFSHLNVWAYLALAFLTLSVATIIVYCTYACYHSAKKTQTSKEEIPDNDRDSRSGIENGFETSLGENDKGRHSGMVDEERGHRDSVLSNQYSSQLSRGGGTRTNSKSQMHTLFNTSSSSLLTSSQSHNMRRSTHHHHDCTNTHTTDLDSKESEGGEIDWSSSSYRGHHDNHALPSPSLESVVHTNLKRYDETEAVCTFAAGLNPSPSATSASAYLPKQGGIRDGKGPSRTANRPHAESSKPLKSCLKPSFLTTKSQKRTSNSSSLGVRMKPAQSVSFGSIRNGINGFQRVRNSGIIRGLGLGIAMNSNKTGRGRAHESDSDAYTEMIQLRTRRKRQPRQTHSPPSSLDDAGSITQSSSSMGTSSPPSHSQSYSSLHDKSFAFVGPYAANDSSDDVHIYHNDSPGIKTRRNDQQPHQTSHRDLSSSTQISAQASAAPAGPFTRVNATYLPFHLRPPPPSPTPAHKQNVKRQYAALYRSSKAFNSKSKSKASGSGNSSKDNLVTMGADLELTHSPVSPSPSPSPSFVKPTVIGGGMNGGFGLGLGLGFKSERKRTTGKRTPSIRLIDNNSSNAGDSVAYDAHNIRFAQPPHTPPMGATTNAQQSPQMTLFWKDPKLSPISGEIISSPLSTSPTGLRSIAHIGMGSVSNPCYGQKSTTSSGAATGSTASSNSSRTPLALPISSPILSPIISPTPSPINVNSPNLVTASSTNSTSGFIAANPHDHSYHPPTSSGRPITPDSSSRHFKSPNRVFGPGFELNKGKNPIRSPGSSPRKSPEKRNGMMPSSGGVNGGFSLSPTMFGAPRLGVGAKPQNQNHGGGVGSSSGNRV
ncbi:hypothetical protein CVT24_006918 [Panaeolus cyanescens]|uniref:Uncharacterized protein n=1 Tax=Panaeolus cyanescens TaxID=181874 RepID=A0A409VK58_9AGAR|nr:hypothetical protein CVT24_006918 [Panaeolus cyanescens]